MNETYNSPELISTEREEESRDEITDAISIILIVAYVIIFLFSFVGNSLLIHIVRTRADMRKNPFNWLLVNMAVADVVDVTTTSVFSMTFFIVRDRWIPGIIGAILCKIIPYFLVVSICVAIWTLTVIAADRYLAIVNNRKKPLTSRSVVRSIIVIWLCAGLLFSGQLYKFKTEVDEGGASECYDEWHQNSEMSIRIYKAEMVVRVVITYAVPLAIMAVLYYLIARFLWKHKPPESLSQQAYINRLRKRRAVIKMMMTAVTVFAVCWLPVHVSHIMSQFYYDAYDTIPVILRWLFYWLAHANAAIHPWLFIFFSENLKVETKEIFQDIWKLNQLRLRTVSTPSLFNNNDYASTPTAITPLSSKVAEHTV